MCNARRISNTLARRISALALSLAIAILGSGIQAHGAGIAPQTPSREHAVSPALAQQAAVARSKVDVPQGHVHVANDCHVLTIGLAATLFAVDAPDLVTGPVSCLQQWAGQTAPRPAHRPPR